VQDVNNTVRKSPYHPDVALFLILIPFISAFNYYLTYTDIRFNGFLIMTFLIDTVQGYLGWLGVRYVILLLDRKWPYGSHPVRRIIFQVMVTTFIGLFIIAILTEMVSWIVKGRPAVPSFYTVDLFIISIWFLVINGIYIGLHYYNSLKRTEERHREENRVKSDGLMVRFGRQDVKLAFENISGLYVEGEYVVCLAQGKKYYLDGSLEKIAKKLPESIFFRLNRQYILNRQLISGFRRLENGKLEVMIAQIDGIPPEIQVSRTKAIAFKSWFQPD
jgi:hypothetical protein